MKRPSYGYFGVGVSQHQATDGEKNQISKWADDHDNRDSYLKAMEAMRSVAPWGEASSQYYPMPSYGGWYAYHEITKMLSTTIAERHPEWVTAVGTAAGMAVDVATVGLSQNPLFREASQNLKNRITDSTVNTAGGAINARVDAAGAAALSAKKAACEALPFKKWNDSTLSCEGAVPWTLIIAGASVVGLVILLVVLRPYASLASGVMQYKNRDFRKKSRKRRRK